jgi:adenylate kinase family enzyme
MSDGLLVGGSSCVGKTTACRALAVRYCVAHVETDRTLPADAALQPLAGADSVWDHEAEELCGQLVRAAEAAIPYLERHIQELAAVGGGWVLEGERVHPALARRLAEVGIARGVFVVELDAARIHRTLTERLPGFGSLSARRQETVAQVDRLYNVWLVGESRRHRVACIASQPWASLADRLLEHGWAVAPPN